MSPRIAVLTARDVLPERGRRNSEGGCRLRPVLLCLALSCIAPAAQGLDPERSLTQYVLRSWNERQGLPQNSPMALVQTPDGYLWLGTLEGLVRFDGVRFVVFDRRSNPELSSHRIRVLTEDPAGYLWVGTENGGLLRFDGERFEALPLPDSAGNAWTVQALLVDRGGDLFVGTPEQVLRLDKGAGSLREVLSQVNVCPPRRRPGDETRGSRAPQVVEKALRRRDHGGGLGAVAGGRGVVDDLDAALVDVGVKVASAVSKSTSSSRSSRSKASTHLKVISVTSPRQPRWTRAAEKSSGCRPASSSRASPGTPPARNLARHHPGR